MALKVQSEIYLDVKQRNIQKVVTAHQYDKNTRYILAHIVDEGEPIDISNYNVMFKVYTQDERAILSDDCEKQYETGDVLIKLNESLLCSSGKHMAEVILYNSSQALTTMKFTLVTEGSVFDDERLVSSDEVSGLMNIISSIENIDGTIADLTTIQNRQQQLENNLQSTLSDINTTKNDLEDKIYEVDTKLDEIETMADNLDTTISQIQSDSQTLQNDIATAESLIAQVGDIVEDDTMVRKAQLGVASNEHVTGVATLDENAKLDMTQFPYEIMDDSEVDTFIASCLGGGVVTINGVQQNRDLEFVTIESESNGREYLLL